MKKPLHRIILSSCACLALPAACLAQSMDDYGGFGAGFEPPNVARMTDSDASCEQLFAEADHLERQIAAMPKPEDPNQLSQRMTSEIMASQQKAMQSARTRSVASSLLGMVPGVGGLAAQAVRPGLGSMGDTSEQMQKHMQAIQESTEASMAIYRLQARQEHLTDLFLDRNCKVSQLDAAALAQARQQWSAAPAPAGITGTAIPAPVTDATQANQNTDMPAAQPAPSTSADTPSQQ